MATHQLPPPPPSPQPTDHMPGSGLPAGPESSSDQVEQMSKETGRRDTPNNNAEPVKEERHISTAGSGEQNEPEDWKEDEEDGEEEREEEGEKESEEEDGLSDFQQENDPQNFPATDQKSTKRRGRRNGRSSSSGPEVSKYNTVCYRKIKRGNTKQRIDEFESMMSF
ncbi:ermin-like [Hoplias malabaricus]|uniref:ermin-like n=1 Tax=Hoplias malabaricus TaxID=27720 RepID=UPI003462F61D